MPFPSSRSITRSSIPSGVHESERPRRSTMKLAPLPSHGSGERPGVVREGLQENAPGNDECQKEKPRASENLEGVSPVSSGHARAGLSRRSPPPAAPADVFSGTPPPAHPDRVP
jgi:hypothetical protein